MAYVHGKSAALLMGGYNVSSWFKEASVSTSVETADTTSFGNSAKTYLSGLQDGTMSLSGMFDGDPSAADSYLNGVLGANASHVVTVAPEGITANSVAFSCAARNTSYEISSPVSDIVSANTDIQADGGVNRGNLIAASAAVTATGNGTALDNAAATGLTVNISSITFSTPTVTVNTSASHLLTTGEMVQIAGATSTANNGTFIVASTPSATQFTLTNASGVAQGSAGGTVTSLPAGGGVGYLHVTANTRDGASTFKVQHSTDNVTFADLITFASVSAATLGGERVAVTGTVNRYVRATHTLAGSTGSVTYTINFARR